MAKAYSLDLRTRVLADYDEGVQTVELARRYRVSAWWVHKLVRQRRETGRVAPLAPSGGRKRKLAGHDERIRKIVREHADATLMELREKLGVSVGLTTLWKTLRRLKLTLKKSHARRRTEAA